MPKNMPNKETHKYAKVSFILSLFFWLPAINIFTSILAIVFGITFFKEIKKNKTLKGKGLAIAGITIGLTTLVLSFIGMVIYFFAPELLE